MLCEDDWCACDTETDGGRESTNWLRVLANMLGVVSVKMNVGRVRE